MPVCQNRVDDCDCGCTFDAACRDESEAALAGCPVVQRKGELECFDIGPIGRSLSQQAAKQTMCRGRRAKAGKRPRGQLPFADALVAVVWPLTAQTNMDPQSQLSPRGGKLMTFLKGRSHLVQKQGVVVMMLPLLVLTRPELVEGFESLEQGRARHM